MQPEFNRIARFAPIIGLLLGICQSILWLFLNQLHWNYVSISFVVIAFGGLITGGLHLDGLMDTADGLAAGNSRCLEAMKDSRAGASAVIVLNIILLIQIAALSEMSYIAPFALPIALIWGRVSSLLAIKNGSYFSHKNKKSLHHLHWKGKEEAIPSVILFAFLSLTLIIFSINGENIFHLFLLLSSGLLPAYYVPKWLKYRLGWHNGDTYGACVVLSETFTLLIIAILFNVF